MAAIALQRNRSVWGSIALLLGAISAIGIIGLVVGHLIDPNHFSNSDNKQGTLDNVFWYMFFFGGILALLAGVAAWVMGRRAGRQGDVLAGKLALGYIVVGLIAIALISNFG